ncbi:membrane protein insertion efficiency factor YidD [Candidatus Entotheonella palauensis]|uniref:Uncharacterized protein n=1 Tax=Candidatus Entotheonella gemina TaxID=1429439 RepID=W4LUP0_9BACT|nr:membrane protein insertion efficiency factor YidD [Candidatus Entotheonella palauensis]ETX01152.1 MAG: hypothetical protein ETSY2_37755 [Candidatus Entotheonella gemina]
MALLFTVWLGPVSLPAAADANPMRAPQQMVKPNQPSAPAPSEALPTSVFDRLLRFYQQIISEVDGARSNMYPTGSDYARRVIKKHGVALGIVLTAERLLHEGNEKQVSPRIRKYGILRTYDPVEANDWWWHGAENWVYQPRVQQR